MNESDNDSRRHIFLSLPRTSSSKSLYSNIERSKLLLLPISHQKSMTNLNQSQIGSELEWDKELDFVRKAESDTLSFCDINERIQELLKQKILEFEVMSLSDSTKNLSRYQNSAFEDEFDPIIRIKRDSFLNNNGLEISPIELSSTNASNLATPADCLTIDDLFKMKFLISDNYGPITFDIESSISNIKCEKIENYVNKIKNFNSIPDLRHHISHEIQMYSKHLSLIDLKNFNFIYLEKSNIKRVENEPNVEKPGPKLNFNFSRMSRLDMLKLYMTRLGEKVKQVLKETFTNKSKISSNNSTLSNNLYSINEESYESYDIIESDTSILKQH
ncbi:unnamed protein product [Brachionus calyciflorus]|uniref:Uncharacterized protein n=1 Tax=Brachionus calyciflorus TaxID=104777 RepID=A0A813SB67_9BILA|nr:unnamed protein product [Brachionus calyciflorus]